MICSKCRYDEDDASDTCDRYLCVEGHLICVNCMRTRMDRVRKCPVCGAKVVKKLNVSGLDVPRLEITQVNSCMSLVSEEVVQLEPCKENFEQLESIEGIEPPSCYLREENEPFLIDLSSDESHSDVLRNGRTYFRQEKNRGDNFVFGPKHQKTSQNDKNTTQTCTNHVSSNQFPFKVSYDSVEINKDPRERQICNFYDTLPTEHEHVIAVNSYNEPCALPYIVLERRENESDAMGVSQDLNSVQNIVHPENFLQFFRVLSHPYYEPTQQHREENHRFQPPLTNKSDKSLENTSVIPSVTTLSMSRAPIVCPISTCSKVEFESHVIKHLQIDHPRVLLEMISPGVEKRHLWDTRTNKRDVRKCLVLYLVKNRIRDLGNTEFRDYLPVLVMTTKFKPSVALFDDESEKMEESQFMIWVTGLAIKEVPVTYTLTLYSEQEESPGQKIVFCNEIYSWRKNQTPKALYESGNALILTHQQYTKLIRNGRDMIRMKILID